MKYGEFPVYYPQVLARETFAAEAEWTKPEQNKYKGLIYCRVRAPEQLRRPLLPYRTPDGRLVFPLCRRCADERNQLQDCTHDSDRDRTWAEAFTHFELNKALSLGYVVTEVYEVHHWRHWAHQGGIGIDAPLFAGYINAFIKMKLEASGWPEQCKTEEEKQRFLEQCRLQDGVELDPAELDKGPNPALRQIAVYIYFKRFSSLIYIHSTWNQENNFRKLC